MRSKRIRTGRYAEYLEARTLLSATVIQSGKDTVLGNIHSEYGNQGGLPELNLYSTYQTSNGPGGSYRPLIEFSLPTREAIDPSSATLELYQVSSGASNMPMDVQLRAINRVWQEGAGLDPYDTSGGASWQNASTGPTVEWTTDGGDFYGTFGTGSNQVAGGVIDTDQLTPGDNGSWISFDVSDAISAWDDSEIEYYGFAIEILTGDYASYQFASFDNSNAAIRPRLTIQEATTVVPNVSISGGGTVSESSGQVGFTISLSEPTSVPVTVTYSSASGSATSPGDFTAVNNTHTFSPGQTSHVFSLNIVDDSNVESTENFNVQLTNVTGGNITNGFAGVSIVDNDTPPTSGPIVIQTGKDTILGNIHSEFGNQGGLTELSFYSTYQTSNGPGGSYRPLVEFDLPAVETINPSSATLELYQISSGGSNMPMNVQVRAISREWEEGNGLDPYDTSGGASWQNASTSPAVQWTTDGGDFYGTFGTGSNQVSGGVIDTDQLTPGDNGSWVSFDVSDAISAWKDGEIDYYGFAIEILTGDYANYQFASFENSNATIRPKLTITEGGAQDLQVPAGVMVTEGDSGSNTKDIVVTLSAPATQPLSFTYETQSGVAISGVDFQSASGPISFAIGDTSKTVTVTVLGDTEDEANEDFTVDFRDSSGVVVGSTTVTIDDDDGAVGDYDLHDFESSYIGSFELPGQGVTSNGSRTFSFSDFYGGTALTVSPGGGSLFVTGGHNLNTATDNDGNTYNINANPVVAEVQIPQESSWINLNNQPTSALGAASFVEAVDLSFSPDGETGEAFLEFAPSGGTTVEFAGNGDADRVQIMDLMLVGNTIVGTAHVPYGNGGQSRSHFVINTTDLANLTDADVLGLFDITRNHDGSGGFDSTLPGLDGSDARYFAGYMAEIPGELQSQFDGKTHLTGIGGGSIASGTSIGPSAVAFDAGELGDPGYTQAELQTYYPLEHPLEFIDQAALTEELPFNHPAISASAKFNITSTVRGATFVPDTQTVLFFGSTAAQSLDASNDSALTGYGDGPSYSDPYNIYQGTHSQDGDYEYQIWAYDVADLTADSVNPNGSWNAKDSSSLLRFEFPGFESTPGVTKVDGAKVLGGIALDPVTQYLYVTQLPTTGPTIVHVYDLGASNNVRVEGGEAQSSVSDPPPTVSQLSVIRTAAIDIWQSHGISNAELNQLQQMSIVVADLGGGQLASVSGNTIVIDINGAGYGWFVDDTPTDNNEFSFDGSSYTATNGGAADGKIDLLSILLHEMGHAIGEGHTDDGLMNPFLGVGYRYLP